MRARPKPMIPADVKAFGAFAAITVVAVGFRFFYDNWLSGFDMFTYFLPTYEYLGQRLREFAIPAWNPHVNSGQPAAGDPGAGWMYVPAMVGMFLFRAGTGIKAMVMIQALIGGGSTYLFARRIGLLPVAAFFSATTFAIGAPLYDATGQSTVIGQVSTFLPLGMLGAEAALQAARRPQRLGWSCLAGIAISQMFLAWPQGFMYGTMMIGGWLVYRWWCHLRPDDPTRSTRLRRAIEVGIVMGIAAGMFGAAGILPRLDFSRHSNIPGGDYSNVIGGNYVEATASWAKIIGHYLEESVYWRITLHSSVALLLVLAAVLFGWRRFGIPFFAIVALLSIDLAASFSVTRWLFYIVPPFEQVHAHRPTATMYLVFLPFAILAGAGFQLVLDRRGLPQTWKRLWLPFVILGVVMVWVSVAGHEVGPVQPVVALAAGLLIALFVGKAPARFRRVPVPSRRMTAIGLIALMLVYPTGGDLLSTMISPANYPDYDDLLGKDEETQTAIATMVVGAAGLSTSAAFMQSRDETQPPFRYAWYLGMGYAGSYINSSNLRLKPGTLATLANGRSVFLGLEEIAGYNPIHLADYVEYSTVMNGVEQNYHWLDTYGYAIAHSQLLDMLNVRYVLVDATIPAEREDVAQIRLTMNEAYRDDTVIIYENPYAYPRAWIVHVVHDNGGGEGLAQLSNGSVNGHNVAFVNGPMPAVTYGDGSFVDAARVISRDEESMTIEATANGAGLLVVSEVYEHNWRAWVDGEEVAILRTNQALRGIPIPNGKHTVTMKYQPHSLVIGLWVTGAGIVAMFGIWTWAAVDWRRRRSDRFRTP